MAIVPLPTRFSGFFTTVFDRFSHTTAGTDTDLTWADLCKHLMESHSEAEDQRIAKSILQKYHAAPQGDALAFFDLLLNDYDLTPKTAADAAAAYRAQSTQANYNTLIKATQPPRLDIFRKIANVHNGAQCLVKMRQDIRAQRKAHPDLARLDTDLLGLLSDWFNRGFLVLEPISWKTPAHILEKIIAYEAVHEIQDWDDLRRRLHPHDRRCYAFFHPRMPDDPIIFVEVALTADTPNSVDALLDATRTHTPMNQVTTACFYSISNCHAGLAGISFGNALIKQVASVIAAELPMVENFVTLSPVPLLSKHAGNGAAQTVAQYLVQGKRPDALPIDPVARFHLGNGAQLYAIHENANTSPRGARESYGTMVNYRYDLAKVDTRAEAFATAHIIAHSKPVAALLS